ncbi:hypothetical protein BKA67DRAFT_514830 [Truncatella angustata]|uniref:Uncharacterized protein n=1 Tax=Truncatella angustata TaxID=152316 RepID=A0A9P8UTB9_9PEZI|nr:uncharacterized protein BKA67DRAFT_514830 [Truncatella angustata]KAH6657973.1 hypothetical protein BKA67DRAFT_514830 [Truncatella angustata]KAH8198815.1 hypothetical protein TruAng_007038 [Truncatella angustata]
MATANILVPSTTGTLTVWGGTKDGKDGYIDYETVTSNLIPPATIEITAHDIRHFNQKPSYKDNGYELVNAPTSITTEQFLGSSTPEGKEFIDDAYYKECTDLVRRITGSTTVFPISFRIRQDKAPREEEVDRARIKLHAGSAGSHGPRPVAHVDRDPSTATTMLRDLFGDQKAAEMMKEHNRWAQVNVWRPIENVVQKWPLAFMNHDRIPDWDYDKFTGRIYNRNDPRVEHRGEKAYDCLVKNDPRYMFHYASNMTPSEALVFSSFDTDVRFVIPHSAFWDDNTPQGALPRKSIEVRTLVFW